MWQVRCIDEYRAAMIFLEGGLPFTEMMEGA